MFYILSHISIMSICDKLFLLSHCNFTNSEDCLTRIWNYITFEFNWSLTLFSPLMKAICHGCEKRDRQTDTDNLDRAIWFFHVPNINYSYTGPRFKFSYFLVMLMLAPSLTSLVWRGGEYLTF